MAKLDAQQTAKFQIDNGRWQYEFDLYRDDVLVRSRMIIIVDPWTKENEIRKILQETVRAANEHELKIKESQGLEPPDFNGKINVPEKP